MNYELALKLKEAGFPIKDREDCEIGNCWENGHEHCYPTLSELIEACGDGLWYLITEDGQYSVCKEGVVFTGNTKEEAVANLWLELNKKKI